MKIELAELLRQVGNEGDIEETANLSFPEDGLIMTKPVAVKLHLTNTGSSILVKGTLRAEAELECSRCLKKYQRPLTVEVSETYTRQVPALPHGKEAELKESDFVYPIEDDNTIDLSELIRQNLLLALPIKSLCDNNCKGV